MMRGRPRGVRDVLELRRGRPPLRPRARRHARGAAQARPAVRPDRPRPALRAAALRARRPLRPRPDAGRDVQAAQRLRPRRPVRQLARRDGRGRRGGDENATVVGHAVAEATGTEAPRARRRRRTTSSDEQVVVLGSGNLGLVYLMEEPRRLTLRGDRRAPPGAAPGAARAPARRLPARPLERARRGRARRDAAAHWLDDGRVEGEDPLAPFSPNAAAAPAPHRRLRATSPTSWSTASTTPSSTRAARSRS